MLANCNVVFFVFCFFGFPFVLFCFVFPVAPGLWWGLGKMKSCSKATGEVLGRFSAFLQLQGHPSNQVTTTSHRLSCHAFRSCPLYYQLGPRQPRGTALPLPCPLPLTAPCAFPSWQCPQFVNVCRWNYLTNDSLPRDYKPRRAGTALTIASSVPATMPTPARAGWRAG